MIPELGHLAMILALCLAVVQGTLPLIGAWRGDSQWMGLAQPAAWGQFSFLAFSFACLTYAFMVDDFSVAYVAQNSNSALPWYYKFSAVWGAHEGSLLLWAFILAGWTFAVSIFSRQLPEDMLARVLGVMGLISIGFLLFLIVTSNPFERLLPQAPMDGRDLNPLLQDFGLVVHPPMLYMGYVGFSVAFAFAIAALLGGRLDAAWARWSRPWTLIAWAFLGTGIALGSWWAYYELGWGGWWFWDPVENASFMPWLVGTALIHSLAVTEKRGVFKSWTVLLAIAAFSLSLLGTFLVRSGVLTSVHAFATDPERGVFILAFLLVVIGGSLTLFALRAPVVKSQIGFGLWSRETLLLVNNLLLVVATSMILLGTLYPLLLDALSDTKLSVGPPYFNAMFLPLIGALMLALGVGVLVRWKNTPVKWLIGMLTPVLITSAVLGGLGSMLFGDFHWAVLAVCLLAGWVVSAGVRDILDKTRHKGLLKGLRSLAPSYWGMQLAHFGLVVCALGVVLTSQQSDERDLRLAPGESLQLGGYSFVFDGAKHFEGPNFTSDKGTIRVFEGDKQVATLHPEKRLYTVQQMPMTEAGIDAGFTRDLYVALGEPLENGAWAVRVHIKPFVRWIWLGALMMSLGGVLSVSDKRYRVKVRTRVREALGLAQQGA
ncbi:MAG: heme lyase CcmF/NrfE family subunit [Gammaproteobacteria bacterium]|jgi:cytochrome c-type biogenesis protein CcmF|uniref:heme lyase CcmF/NrfE family subunit n=1 Tax=Pseudomonadaceae TaxID=135621 RepID=UPI0012F0E2D4|nr:MULTISPECIES: heme lyase CcmF/NrfE family subunit [Pseudomonadaceae]MBU0810822.1 heme lyase CcmF/NrfE family subunit [Gammaproteobacteria bacterium]MBK3848400.1 heme lyase CcmF/NrfE family subunit [Stutzerimonas xanthomarina]MBU0854421.1 heme lyase CcmF/NrfE family subunit [Gammaproteobacteria bacterium]MBU1301175.1 heme lyase CcmF/NrfE family subunit [Gammaproteobacteria bacterium]MBU1458268.1 heme lyase CcmF/NrfE family subunit [Gammaproteobacteria bacterium]|tara:strand:+ start:28576 stop:30549 length:1974 start_codon:yes stop_codon:yes gene_type:complete